jgi:hypothetical protein
MLPSSLRIPRPAGWLRRTLFLGTAAGVLLGLGGCTRRFFRRAADHQVECVIKEKEKDPRWALGPWHVYPDPRARFADPTNPDHPCKPPDDQAAYQLSPDPQPVPLKRVAYVEGDGYMKMLEAWDAANRREKEEREKEEGPEFPPEPLGVPGSGKPLSPRLPARLYVSELPPPVTTTALAPTENLKPEKQGLLLKLEQAVELAFINSRNLQTHREALYLAALPVTAQRFSFAAQFFATEDIVRRQSGINTPVGSSNIWSYTTDTGFSKLFSTGALLLASFANTTIINLGNAISHPVTSTSTVSLDIVQPFLQGAGRAVTLEPLTQVERNLLYAIRDFVRFQQEYFCFIAAGQPTFIPGVQPGVQALAPDTTVTATPTVPFATPLVAPLGITLGVAPQVTPALADGNLLPTSPFASTPQGFFPTIVAKVQLANYVKNVRALEDLYDLLKVYEREGIVNPVQTDSLKQTIYTSLETVLANQRTFYNGLDEFKIQLGIPPALRLDLDIGPLRPMFQMQKQYEAAAENYQKVIAEAQAFDVPGEPEKLRGRLRGLLTGAELVKGLPFQTQVVPRLAYWERISNQPPRPGEPSPLAAQMERLRAARAALLERQRAIYLEGQEMPPEMARRLDEVELELNIAAMEQALRQYEAAPWRRAPKEAVEFERRQIFLRVYYPFSRVLEEAVRQRQAKIDSSWPPLPSLCVNNQDLLPMSTDDALILVSQTALQNRLDLMNQRAQLVDYWRKVRVAANALLGTFNVEYNLTSYSPPGQAKPFAFSPKGTENQLIFNAQPPLVRILQRNEYRATLIAFQQQRRSLMLAEDNVVFEARLDLRQVRDTAYNYQYVQKRNFPLAYLQRDRAVQAFLEPATPPGPAPVPGSVALPSTGGGPGDPAALTRQLIAAQGSLLTAQNDLYARWILYKTARIFLYRDLGLMPLDNRGVWIEDVTECKCAPQSAPSAPEQPPAGGPEQPPAGGPERLPPPRTLPPPPSTPLEPAR